jgi:hypothetical protein
LDENVAPDGSRLEVNEVMGSPSGSDAFTANVSGLPSEPVTLPGAVTTGARSVFWIVIWVDAAPERAFVAVNVKV